ncbi:MAG: hypothetical protein LBK95_01445 [Bifidobacteriaceae bacterium]|nr:hypothetical protein [Bifidobacteriaceae bacterium]
MRIGSATMASLVFGLVAVGGCSGGNGVPSLDRVALDDRPQAEIARAMVECLRDLGVPAHELSLDGIVDGLNGQVVVDFPEDQLVYVSDGFTTSTDDYDNDLSETELEAQRDQLYLLADKHLDGDVRSDEPFLIVGANDYTDQWVKCLKETGYVDPTTVASRRVESKEMRWKLDATLAWLDCARDNGYPSLKDPDPPPADGYTTEPMALLPGKMTESELRQLLLACPNFDKEAHLGADQMETDGTEAGWEAVVQAFPGVIDPVIGFDVPGFNGDTHDGAMDGLSDADQNRLYALRDILEAEAWEYHRATAK